MAYRDPTFNANILTDLLSTYLQQKSNERDRYFKAEQQARKANQPVIRPVGGNLVSVDPVTQQVEVIYQGPQKVTTPKLTKVEDEQGGVTLQPETVGLRTKPPKKEKEEKIKLQDVIKQSNARRKELINIKEKKADLFGQRIDFSNLPFGQEELDFHKSVLKNPKKWMKENPNQLPIYAPPLPEVSTPTVSKGSFWED